MQRNTLQRQVIMNAATKLGSHPTIEEVYAEVQKKYPAISKTTVYRNLRQLANNGLLRQVSLPDGLERYDTRTNQHYHFECKRCGSIFDVDIGYIAGIDGAVHEKYGFDIEKHDVIFTGLCPKCGNTAPGKTGEHNG